MPLIAFFKRRKTCVLLALAVGIVGGAWWWAGPPREPMCGDLLLTEWLNNKQIGMSASGWTTHGDSPEFLESMQKMEWAWEEDRSRVLRAVGPRAVKWLAFAVEHGRHEDLPASDPPHSAWVRWLREKLFHRAPSLLGDERICAAEALGWMGPDAAPAIPALVRAMDSDNEDLARYCAQALPEIGPTAWPAIKDRLEHGREEVRYLLIDPLPHILFAPDAPPTDREVAEVVAALVRACGDTEHVRRAAISRLRQWPQVPGPRPMTNDVVAGLTKLLGERNSALRADVADILEDYTTDAEPAIPSLIEVLDDPEPQTRAAAARALRAIDTRQQRSAIRLRQMLSDPDTNCQVDAARALDAFASTSAE